MKIKDLLELLKDYDPETELFDAQLDPIKGAMFLKDDPDLPDGLYINFY